MKFKGFYYDILFISLLIMSGFLFVAVTLLKFDIKAAIAEAVILLIVIIFGFIRMFSARFRYRRMLSLTAEKLDYSDNKVLSALPFPVAVCDGAGYIRWTNEKFYEASGKEINQASNISDYFGEDYDPEFNRYVKIQKNYYLVNSVRFKKDGAEYTAYSFIDNTELKDTEFKYIMSRPYVVVFQTDNIDDNINLSRDSEKSELKSKVDGIIDSWSDSFNSVVKKISDDRLMIVTEKENIDKMIEDGFSVLEKVRDCTFKEKNMQVTLSVGVASGENIKSAEKLAKKSLDTAISRGGDQTAFLLPDGGYRFFGAVSKSADKRNKIKSKLWSSQLFDEIKRSSNVLICGHKAADYDSLGAAFGIAYACITAGKRVNLIYNSKISLAEKLADEIRNSEFGYILITDEEASKLIDKNTLFILTDTHNPSICDAPVSFSLTERKAVIDHHRLVPGTQTENYLFIHDPNASSACEIVSEILQNFMKDDRIPDIVATALLSGIILDTKEFILRTGVTTFETAAYLKNSGADTVKVNRFFSLDAQTSRDINDIVGKAEIKYGCYAVSVIGNKINNVRLAASKSADELLKISGVRASFVIYRDDTNICISARSMGETNVQIIMESLGGGGHQTMAACQIKSIDFAQALNRLDNLLQKTLKEN